MSCSEPWGCAEAGTQVLNNSLLILEYWHCVTGSRKKIIQFLKMTEIVVHAATMMGFTNTVLIELTKLPKYKSYELAISYIIQSNEIHRKRRLH